MITQDELNEIKEHVKDCGGLQYTASMKLINVAQAFIDTADHVLIAKCEYDYLTQRSHRLEELEL